MCKTIHVDMSGKFYKKENIGIAYVSAKDRKDHKGTALRGRVIKSLIKEYDANYDFARLYAICIYLLIKDDVQNLGKIIICNDEHFKYVKDYLFLLFGDGHLDNVKIYPIDYFRKTIGRNINSLADGRASSYRKRGLKKHLWLRGTNLNFVKINHSDICKHWEVIDEILKEKGEE